jgi:hypothetical protein
MLVLVARKGKVNDKLLDFSDKFMNTEVQLIS